MGVEEEEMEASICLQPFQMVFLQKQIEEIEASYLAYNSSPSLNGCF